LGRLSIGGLWSFWSAQIFKNDSKLFEKYSAEVNSISTAVRQIILTNPTLLLPIKDDQAIDISIAVLLLIFNDSNHNEIKSWLTEIINRATFAFQIEGQYPTNLSRYSDLLEHPQRNDDSYFQEATSGSILFPFVALWAALLDENDLYQKVQKLKQNKLSHCTFQFWYPDDDSEDSFYTNKDSHGAILTQVCIERGAEDFLKQVFSECENSSQFKSLSAVKFGLWPLILVASRHYRLPVPLHLWEDLYEGDKF
jgi:hypothetical protein